MLLLIFVFIFKNQYSFLQHIVVYSNIFLLHRRNNIEPGLNFRNFCGFERNCFEDLTATT